MLIIPGINKFACLLTIKTHNSRTARNVLRLLCSYQEHVLFPCRRSRYLESSPCAMFILTPYIPSWHLRFDAGSLSDLPAAMYIHIQPWRFVYVAIRLFRPHKYLTPFWKSHLHAGTKCVWYHYRRTPTFNWPSTAVVPSTRRIPWDTVFHNIYILSLLVVNSSDSGCYANYEIA